MTAQAKIEAPPNIVGALAIEGQPDYKILPTGEIWSRRAGRTIRGTSAGQMRYRAIHFPDGSRRYIHRLVCEAFHGPAPEAGMMVRHINGDRYDNRPANLTWATKDENERDKFLHGTNPAGEKNPMAKLSDSTVRQMRELREQTGLSYAKLADRFGVATMTAFRAITGRAWNG